MTLPWTKLKGGPSEVGWPCCTKALARSVSRSLPVEPLSNQPQNSLLADGQVLELVLDLERAHGLVHGVEGVHLRGFTCGYGSGQRALGTIASSLSRTFAEGGQFRFRLRHACLCAAAHRPCEGLLRDSIGCNPRSLLSAIQSV